MKGRRSCGTIVVVVSTMWRLTERGVWRRWRNDVARLIVVGRVVVMVMRMVVTRVAIARGTGLLTPVWNTMVMVVTGRPVTLRHGIVVHRLCRCHRIGSGTYIIGRITRYLKLESMPA